MPLALAATDLAVSRAGAMATSELMAWGIPSILIPLPTAAADHQTRNAEALREAGASVHIRQGDATGTLLWGAVRDLLSDSDARARMAKAARERGRPDAVREIARALDALLPPPQPELTS
jgi:UDP-N-acetylglucosamine--N-acetylmuramyl-(pentapeptide) pyrophosphoryl-undecaprenol N-acetylglucosamine transferase